MRDDIKRDITGVSVKLFAILRAIPEQRGESGDFINGSREQTRVYVRNIRFSARFRKKLKRIDRDAPDVAPMHVIDMCSRQ